MSCQPKANNRRPLQIFLWVHKLLQVRTALWSVPPVTVTQAPLWGIESITARPLPHCTWPMGWSPGTTCWHWGWAELRLFAPLAPGFFRLLLPSKEIAMVKTFWGGQREGMEQGKGVFEEARVSIGILSRSPIYWDGKKGRELRFDLTTCPIPGIHTQFFGGVLLLFLLLP